MGGFIPAVIGREGRDPQVRDKDPQVKARDREVRHRDRELKARVRAEQDRGLKVRAWVPSLAQMGNDSDRMVSINRAPWASPFPDGP